MMICTVAEHELNMSDHMPIHVMLQCSPFVQKEHCVTNNQVNWQKAAKDGSLMANEAEVYALKTPLLEYILERRSGQSLNDRVLRLSISESEGVAKLVKTEVSRADHRKLIDSVENGSSTSLPRSERWLLGQRYGTKLKTGAQEQSMMQEASFVFCAHQCLQIGSTQHVQNWKSSIALCFYPSFVCLY